MQRKTRAPVLATDDEMAALTTYLMSTRDFWGHYRDRKENAAWVAMTFTLGALFALDYLAVSFVLSGSLRIGLGVLVILSAVLCLAFIKQQNEDRTFAGLLVTATQNTLVRCLRNGYLGSELLAQRTYTERRNYTWYFPRVVYDAFIEEEKRPKAREWNLSPVDTAIIIWAVASILLLAVRG